jgi:hypothetical protein
MRSSFVRAMVFQSMTKFLPDSRWVLGSLLFIADKFGDLNLQEPESCEVNRSGTDHIPPAPVWVDLINEAQLGHGLVKLGKTDPNPSGDKVDHTLADSTTIIDPIYQSSPESESEGNREVYMVGQGEEPPEMTIEEIQREEEEEEEIARTTHLARDAERGKKHNDL